VMETIILKWATTFFWTMPHAPALAHSSHRLPRHTHK
jgi:hypothetical protein